MLSAALLFGVIGQQLFFARAIGLNVLVTIGLLLTIGWWLSPRARRIELADAWLPAAAVVFAALCAIRADLALLLFDAAASAVLAGAWMVSLGGAPVSRLEARALASEVAHAIADLVDRPPQLARSAGGPIVTQVRSRTGRLSRYAGGAALACPFLIVFSVLFASADPVYARRVNELFDIVHWREVFRDTGPRLLLALGIAWVAAAALSKVTRPPLPHAATGGPGSLSVESAVVLLACVDLLFAAFVVLQVGYLFGGRDTIDAAGLPYSEYARRGFFELIACASIVGALLFILGVQGRARSRLTSALGVALVGLTLVVLASAWHRLDLYQLAYGWTELRFYALAAIVFLGSALLVLAGCVVTDRMRFALQPVTGAALAVAFAVNVIGPSSFVARVDLQRVIDPSNLPPDAQRGIDPSYLVSLGDGAFPVLVELLPSVPAVPHDLLLGQIRSRAGVRTGSADAWEHFNVDRLRARQALASLP